MKAEPQRASRRRRSFIGNPDWPKRCGAPIPRAMRAARKVPDLDRASSLRLLLFAGGHAIVPVDESVLRAAPRLGYAGSAHDAAPPTLRLLRAVRRADRGDRRRPGSCASYLDVLHASRARDLHRGPAALRRVPARARLRVVAAPVKMTMVESPASVMHGPHGPGRQSIPARCPRCS